MTRQSKARFNRPRTYQQAVHDYLGHGIDAGWLVGSNGYGETRPIAPNSNEDSSDNPEGRVNNRRIEFNSQN